MDGDRTETSEPIGLGFSWIADAAERMIAGGEAVDTSTTFGTWLRGQRKEHDLTQDALAERVGCSADMVKKVEAGTARPSRQLAELFAAALDVAPAERPGFVTWARTGQPGRRAATATPIPPGSQANPYKGLRAFQESDALDFFGREALTAHLLTRLAGPSSASWPSSAPVAVANPAWCARAWCRPCATTASPARPAGPSSK
jgi:transcriptional regulator with XRE-family HTH domain